MRELIIGILIFFVTLVGYVISVVINIPDKQIIGAGESLTDVYLGGKHRPELTALQRKVATEYNSLKLPKYKIPFADFCFPKKFKLQNPQKFAAKYMAPGVPYGELLGFHKIGSGKTCLCINTAELWTSRGKPLVVLPASLVPGFLNELRGKCSPFPYITESTRDELRSLPPSSARYKEIIKESNELIYSRYDVMSYNKFMVEYRKLNPPIMFIDEVHNINNINGSYYNRFYKFIQKHPKMKLVILTATPVFDNPVELIALMRLMRKNVDVSLLNNPTALRKELDGLVSYYTGAPQHTFPQATLKFDICRMSPFQSKWFRAEVEAEIQRSGKIDLHSISNNFYNKSRAKSNIVFPRGLSGSTGLPKLTKEQLSTSLDTYSCKFARMIRRLKKSQLSFVYTSFTSFGGIKSIRRCLHAHGFTDYNKAGAGPKRFAIWSGEQTSREKDAIRNVFNNPDNDDASMIQIIIGSPAAKEGVSFLRVRQVHVLEPYWNHSRLEQIYGRAIRFCSHKSLPRDERTVMVYLYLAVVGSSKITQRVISNLERAEISPLDSVDLYILKIANSKRITNEFIIQQLIDAAVDRGLNQ